MNITEQHDIWTYLSQANKPIVLYGTGDGADKIVDAMSSYGTVPDDYFASDGFVRGQSFHGKKVLSFAQVKEKYNDFIILQSFGSSLDDVLQHVYELDRAYEYYAPDVPLYGGELFTYDYFLRHKKEIDEVYDSLFDERSRYVYKCLIEYKLSGKLRYLIDSDDTLGKVLKEIYTGEYTYFCDGGAYRGESSILAGDIFPSIRDMYAFEPDPSAYKKLCEVSLESCAKLTAYNAALADKISKTKFYTRKNRSSSANPLGSERTDTKYIEIDVMSADSVLPKDRKGLIKLDVEGNELEALNGAVESIRAGSDLQISLYHKSSDVFTIPLFIKNTVPDADLYIRRIPYIPAWDAFISVIQNKKS